MILMKRVSMLIVMLFSISATAQNLNYLADGVDRTFESKKLGKSMNYSVYIPKTMTISQGVKYPVAYVFDRQNSRSCNNVVQSIDYLMGSFALPSFIVVTIEQDERLYETSFDVDKQGRGGIEPFLDFVLEELDSFLITNYNANEYRILIGHSRTAFLTTYALSSRHDDVHAVIANSPFFESDTKTGEVNLLESLLKAQSSFDGNRYYSFSYGGEGVDAHFPYGDEAVKQMKTAKVTDQLRWDAKLYPYADHYTVVGLHTMNALADFGFEYANVLHRFINEPSGTPKDVEWLKTELATAGEYYGMTIVPELVHINSMASHFYHEKDLEQVIFFLKYGLEFYPKDSDLHVFIGSVYGEMGDKDAARQHYQHALEYLDMSPWYSNSEKEEFRAEVEQLFNALE